MKIEEAITKWCPFARVREQCDSTVNYNGNIPPPGTLQVMMPQVAGYISVNRDNYDKGPGMSSQHKLGTKCIANQCMAWRTVLNDPNDGHCGLAGFQPHGG